MQPTYNAYRKSYGLTKFKSVRYITLPEVYEIYYTMYYLPAGCDTLPPALALVHLDASINFGIYGSKKLFLKAIGDYYDPIFDKELALCYIEERKTRRYEIVQNPYKKKFLKGWLNRDNKLSAIVEHNY